MTENPAALGGDEFHDWIAHNLNYKNDWSQLLVSEHLNRTIDSVEGLIDSLERQIEEHGGKNEVWDRRTRNMLKMAEGRLRQLRRHASVDGNKLVEWKAFAHSLVDIIDDSDMADELDIEMAPVGGLTARQWRDRRDEKRGEVVA